MAAAVLLLLLLLPALAAAQAQAQQMRTFSANDTNWSPAESNRTLVSNNGYFAAGFRPSPSSPAKFWFAVWVSANANESRPVVIWYAHNNNNHSAVEGDANSVLSIDAAGKLSWSDNGNSTTLWSPNSNSNSTSAPLSLNDSGSLDHGAWSSFGEPTDTLMASQAIPSISNGTTTTTTTSITLQSQNGRFQLVNALTLQHGSSAYANITGNTALRNLTADGTLQLAGGNPSQLIASDQGSTRLRRLTLDDDGNLRLYSLQSKKGQWRVVWQLVQELCTIRGACQGEANICVPQGADNTTCVCPPGYRPQGLGCAPKLNYSGKGNDDKFVRMDFVSFSGGADTGVSVPGKYMTSLTPQNLADCQSKCRANASCVAFGYKLGGDRTCLHYTRLVDGYWSPATEMSTYLRVVESNNDPNNFTGMTTMIDTVCPVRLALPVPPKQGRTTIRNIAIITALFAVELLAGVLSFWAFLRKYSQYREMARTLGLEYLPAGGPRRFSYAELKAATKEFSDMVGRGAYGKVYRGELPDRRAVAVKQLDGVGGGEAEFWAEVTIIARMHHLNLVRMWGFCADKEQRMLVYEYVPNGSLDKYLFAPGTGTQGDEEESNKRPLLDLHTRYRIALGVARAIAYLHEECLEWVLHCDIKPENILLEDDFCPKVSDFGLSKLTSKKEKVTMSRIRGTRGYMAPEWVIHREPITAKADVYSFGMVLLEIVSGRRNYGFRQDSVGSEDWYLPKWAFEKVYVERRIDDIIDPRIVQAEAYDDDPASLATVERMVKTAMWCLQDRADMRPSMGKVAKMLEGTVEITEPVKPTIFCVQDD